MRAHRLRETATIKLGSSGPNNTSSVTIGSVTYVFETSNITNAPSSGCQVYSASGSTGATSLYQALTLTGTPRGAPTSPVRQLDHGGQQRGDGRPQFFHCQPDGGSGGFDGVYIHGKRHHALQHI